MPVKHVIQIYARGDGAIVPGRRIAASSGPDAVAAAQAMVPSVVGAAALAIMVDEPSFVRTITVLATAGDVPADFAERLMDDAERANERR